MLPPPKDPNFEFNIPEEDYWDRTSPEDEKLLATGAWDDDIDKGTGNQELMERLDRIIGIAR